MNDNQPFPPGVELQLSFDRLTAEYSVLKINDSDDTLKGKVLVLKNVFAQVKYVSSPILRNFVDQLMISPITYKNDECTVLWKTLPKAEQEIRLENIRALNGSTSSGSTCFKNNGVKW